MSDLATYNMPNIGVKVAINKKQNDGLLCLIDFFIMFVSIYLTQVVVSLSD